MSFVSIGLGRKLLLSSGNAMKNRDWCNWLASSRRGTGGGSSFSVASPLLGGSRSITVPYVPVSTRKMYKNGSHSIRRRVRRAKESYSKPTMDIARSMPLSVQEMDNQGLVTLGAIGDHEARKEILKRHIMTVDNVSYDEACATFREKIYKKNQEYMYLNSLPYQVGITVAGTAAFVSIPMCFHIDTVKWFNYYYVTTDVPEPRDLETWLEVGSWAWNWMEPVLGQVSFFLLCLQYCRAQLQNLGFKPYTNQVKRYRAERLAKAFPQYDAAILIAYSESSHLLQNSKK